MHRLQSYLGEGASPIPVLRRGEPTLTPDFETPGIVSVKVCFKPC